MHFSVCIPAWRAETVGAAIRSVLAQRWSAWELIVVGQGPGAGAVRTAAEAAAAGDERVRYVHSERAGTTVARNVGTRAARYDTIALLDDDCEADVEWLATIADRFANSPEVGLVSGAVIGPAPTQRGLTICPEIVPPEAIYNPACGDAVPTGWGWIGCNVAIRRSALGRAGPFDECLGPGSKFPAAEDSDYLLRLEALGVPMLSTPKAIVYHSYGRRYGLKTVFNHSRNYARGNGALAAKLTLQGDPRGIQWSANVLREATLSQLSGLRLHRLPFSLLRLYYFRQSYDYCLRAYRAHPDGTLKRLVAPPIGAHPGGETDPR